MITIFMLIAILISSDGQPHVIVKAFPSDATCKTAEVEATTAALKLGITDGSITCTPMNIGKLT